MGVSWIFIANFLPTYPCTLPVLKKAKVVTLTPTQLDELRSARNALPQPDAPTLKPWYDALKGRYSYEILRCVRAEWDRRGM
jgi:hypothetical protein